jgi:hypothetical protein
MSKHTFTTFNYNDENQKLARSLFQFKKSKTYAVERMNLEGLNPNRNDIAEFFVVSEVESQYRKKKTDQWQSLKDFWTYDNILARKCPHWERTRVKVHIGVGIREIFNENENPIGQKLVTFQTWFDNKYNSQADCIATKMVTDHYDETRQQVVAEWNDSCIIDQEVEMNALKNGVGILFALAEHLKQTQAEHNKKAIDIFSKIKI